jgi:hypothetical protein
MEPPGSYRWRAVFTEPDMGMIVGAICLDEQPEFKCHVLEVLR